MTRWDESLLSKSPDVDVLKEIVIMLKKRVQTGAATLLVKVKTHRGDPLNKETDIRTEMGRLREQNEFTWDDPTNRTLTNGRKHTNPRKDYQPPGQLYGPTRSGIDPSKTRGN